MPKVINSKTVCIKSLSNTKCFIVLMPLGKRVQLNLDRYKKIVSRISFAFTLKTLTRTMTENSPDFHPQKPAKHPKLKSIFINGSEILKNLKLMLL